VAELEELGYGALWLGEGDSGKESFSHAAIALAATRRIVIATGISNIWVRDATAMAAGAHTLGEAFPGRFLLGLGVSHAGQLEARGHEYRRPVATMRAYLDGMEAAEYAGPRPPEPVPRVLAALRPRMIELARERTDGVHPYFVPVEHTVRARAALGPGKLLAPEQAVLLERDVGRARQLGRSHLEWYLTMPNYVENLRWLGFGDEDFARGGSDRLVDALVAWGGEDAIRARVRAHLDAGADHVCLQPIGGDGGLGVEQLRELAPALLDL
jgi:probable F420-dependent oxidoreductase